MTTARQLIKQAYKQLLVTAPNEEPTAEESSDSLELFNGMMHDLRNQSVDLFWEDIGLNDRVAFWVPPVDADGASINVATYKGEWDANANSPILSTGVGTSGYVYKVGTSGSTLLDTVSSWSQGDYLIFDGFANKWMKCRSSRQFEFGLSAMLAIPMSSLFSVTPSPDLVSRSEAGLRRMQAAFVVPPLVAVDDALRRMNSNRYINGNLL